MSVCNQNVQCLNSFYYLCYILNHYSILISLKGNDSTLKKAKSRWYLTETMTDTNYADNLVLFVNTAAQVEFLLHSQEQEAGGIDLYVNANKTKYIFFSTKRNHLSLKNL